MVVYELKPLQLINVVKLKIFPFRRPEGNYIRLQAGVFLAHLVGQIGNNNKPYEDSCACICLFNKSHIPINNFSNVASNGSFGWLR